MRLILNYKRPEDWVVAGQTRSVKQMTDYVFKINLDTKNIYLLTRNILDLKSLSI